jgi:hypothetical protein
VLADAAGQTEPSGIEDAKAAAALMAMNNIYRIPPAQMFCRGHKKNGESERTHRENALLG